ncbi:MAG: hypothetical protein ABIG44_10100 [Planctomycetota bacterium]
MNTSKIPGVIVACITLAAFSVMPGLAQLPDPFATCELPGGGGTSAHFGGPEMPPLPADFFGPGSDPFDGQVALQGVPLGPTPWGTYDVADTLVQRSADPFDRADPPGMVAHQVDIEIVALNLVSVAPITVTYNGGLDPELWDVAVELSPGSQLPGVLSAVKTHANGGTFDSVLFVQPKFTFTGHGGGGGPLVLDTRLEGIAANQLDFAGGTWVHDVHPGLDIFVQPGAGFVPGVNEVIPGDPTSQEVVPLHGIDPGDAEHTVCPPPLLSGIPAVSAGGLVVLTLLLLAAGILVARRRRVA